MTAGRPDLHIVVDSNSQSLPLPWRHKEDQLHPELFTRHWQTYPHVARRALLELGEVEVSVFGARGGTIRALLDRKLEVMGWMDDDVLVINHGIVDCWPRKGGQKCPPDEFDRLLGEGLAFARSRRPDRMIVLLGLGFADTRTHAILPSLQATIRQYDAIIRRHAESSGSEFLDVQALQWSSSEPFMHPDAHHFSTHGHGLIGQELARIVRLRFAGRERGLVRWWPLARRPAWISRTSGRQLIRIN